MRKRIQNPKLVKFGPFADTKSGPGDGRPASPDFHRLNVDMARSTPPIPFLKDLAFPQPASSAGSRLARKLGTSRSSGSTKSGVFGYVLMAIFIVPMLMLSVMIMGLAIIALPIALAIPKSRRRVVGWFIGRRRPIDIEISKDPLLPGEAFEGAIYFKKPGAVDLLQVTLQCIEEAKYRRGTSTYTDRHTAFEQTIVEVSNPSADQIRFEGQIPENAMHSFTASNNTIEWQLKVKRIFPGDNIEERSYLLDVYTAELEQALIQYRQKNPALNAPLHGGAR